MEAPRQSTPSFKRQREYVGIGPRKSQRIASRNDPLLSTKINDLNDDCLVKIFSHLDVASLLNVAMANAWLLPAAREAYKQKFGKKEAMVIILKPIKLNRRGCLTGTKYQALSDWHTSILSFGLQLCLPFLRCFGPCISDLVIDYDVSESKYHKYVHQYVNDYIGENLVRITFRNMPSIAIDEIQKVFNNVNKLAIEGLNVGPQWPSMVKCFPNVRSLDIEGVYLDRRLIGKSFQFLEHLYVYDLTCNGFTTNQIVADLTNGANQLKSLRIILADGHVQINELLTMIKDSPLITCFEYSVYDFRYTPVHPDEVQRIGAEYPSLKKLELTNYRFASVDSPTQFIGSI